MGISLLLKATLLFLLLSCASLCKAQALSKAKFYKKIEKLYLSGEYDKALKEIKKLEQERFDKEGNLKYSLRNDIVYYHFKLSAILKRGEKNNLRELVGLYSRLQALDSTKQYLTLPQYKSLLIYFNQVAEKFLHTDQLMLTRSIVNILARHGDTTVLYHSVYPKLETLEQANRGALQEFLIKYDFGEVDKKALAVNKQSAIKEQALELTKGLTHDFEKARAIYSWIVYNITYDYTYSYYFAGDTFKNNSGVCSGFSYLFQEMCYYAGLSAVRITGRAYNGSGVGRHAWNSVELYGYDFFIESTWASCVKEKVDDYFLVDPQVFSKTHIADIYD
ncbi:transglutaminase domain-containing protein [uncultured Pontibacter sp.]|uniref:transglutaminase domain-containing protein n=1 Tax=uncultured Pontibacter sp. TaxID=453356 RepID=UPI00262D09F9|nr:transglutaminase domain-containing protein [uncultured Pontibacter sp.]